MDLIIRNAKIYDGAGNPYFWGDIGIQGDKIAKIGFFDKSQKAKRVIDAKRAVVCPSFIDGHSHSDITILANRKSESALRQGVTTELVGSCGMGSVPVTPKNKTHVKSSLDAYSPGTNVTWKTFREYTRALENPGIGINLVCMIGHGALRYAVTGCEDRKATDSELKKMQGLLSAALDEGAAGLSTGIEFLPGRLIDRRELLALLSVVAKKNKIHTCHVRNRDKMFKEAIDEILEVTEKTGARLCLSHLSAKPGSHKDDWKKIMDKIEKVREKGYNIHADMIGYGVGPGMMYNILPTWMFEGGNLAAVERLRDKEVRKKLYTQCNRYWLLVANKEWDKLSLSGSVEHPDLIGMTFREISKKSGKPVLDCIFDILADAGEGIKHVTMNGILFSQEQVKEWISHPLYCFGADAWVAEIGKPSSRFANHPSGFGWVSRFLSHFVHNERLFTLEEAIRKMTSFPAEIYNIQDRGLIREGMKADIAIFQEKNMKEEVDFVKPQKYSSSMDYVILAGKVVVEKNKLTNGLQGKVLKV